MVLNEAEHIFIPDPDNSTVYTATTPPETVAADLPADDDDDDDDDDLFGGDAKPSYSSSSVPWPGSTFIIRCVSSEQVITLLDGQIVLARPGDSPGSMHWACVETKGWLGFRSPVSGRFLGHDAKGKLCCSAERHRGWENFCARIRPDGGYVLLMTHFDRLWHVGTTVENGVEKLAKIADGGSDGMVWEFVKV